MNSPIRKTKHSSQASNTLDESNFIPCANVEYIKLILAKPSNFRCYDDIITLRSFLAKIPFFIQSNISGLLPKQVNDLCRSLELESFQRDDIIFNQGDIGDKLYIVLSGSVDIIYKSTMEIPGSGPRTREKVLLTCRENSNFGERALESDEPRGASAICTEHTDLITINKLVYTSILKEFSFDIKTAQIQQGSKEYVIKMLSKSRTKRTATEIETCSTYLHKHVSFFHKFNIDQMQELVRVADVVSIFSRQLLFKQGSVGQAFFVVLGGSVDVYVNPNRDQVNMGDEKTFGNKVNTVEEGNSFGERALENDNSLRMGSVFTCDGTTDLFIISKGDFQNLVQVMLNGDSMEKISLLRKTHLFCNVDVKHLRILSKFMESRSYRIDDELITVDEPAENMIIIRSGECRIEKVVSAVTTAEDIALTSSSSIYASTNMKVSSGSGVKHRKHKLSLGRLGACTVLAEYITQTDKLDSEIYHNNTVFATTIVNVFTLNKLDFFYHVPFETREYLIKLIRESTGPLLPHLWDNKIKVMNDYEWKKSEAWKLFREDLKSINKEQNILKNFKTMNNTTVVGGDLDMTNSSVFTCNESTADEESVKSMFEDKKSTYIAPIFNPNKTITKALSSCNLRDEKRKETPHIGFLPVKANHYVDQKTISNPFTLVHFHREPVRIGGGSGMASRRLVKCHMRLCGTVSTCSTAKDAAFDICTNARLTVYKNCLDQEDELNLNWQIFNGYDNMPLQSTDHFIIYCRSAPIEFASLSLSIDLLNHAFPNASKPRDQRYACINVRSLIPPTDIKNNDIDSNPFENEKRKIAIPLFLLELSVIGEVLATTSTYIDCRRFGIDKKVEDDDNSRLVIIKMFEWYLVTDDSMKALSIQNTTSDYVDGLDESTNFVDGLDEFDSDHEGVNLDLIIKQKKEMTRAFTEAGLGSDKILSSSASAGGIMGKYFLDEKSRLNKEIANNITLKMLEQEIILKNLSKNITKNVHTSSSMDQKSNIESPSVKKKKNRNDNNNNNDHAMLAGAADLANPEDKMKAIKIVISERKKALELNDSICANEAGIKLAIKSKSSRYKSEDGEVDSDDEDNDPWKVNFTEKMQKLSKNSNNSNLSAESLRAMSMGSGFDRVNMFNTFKLMSSSKALEKQIKLARLTPINDITKSSSNNNNYKSKKEIPKVNTTISLASKLDALQDVLERTSKDHNS